jgi:hypothetical protein
VAEYVYGIVSAETSGLSGSGIDGAPLRLIMGDRAAALVSTVPGTEVTLDRDALLCHARVLGDALAKGPVLPMRFGVVMKEPREVGQRLLADHDEELDEQLRALAGTVEINIKAIYDEKILMREVVRDRLDVARLAKRGDQATYAERITLGELVANAVDHSRAIDSRNIVDALSQVAVAVEIHEPNHERVACHASFLVARDRLREFDSVVDAFADGQGGRLRFKCTGPLPPHSFVELAGAA